MHSAKVRDSKFGKALVIETSEKSGGYVLGFKMEPESDLERIHQEIKSIKAAFEQSPTFGVDQSFTVASKESSTSINTASSYVHCFQNE